MFGSMGNLTMDAQIIQPKHMMYNYQNMHPGPLSPRIFDKRNIKLKKNKNINYEPPSLRFSHKKVHFENNDSSGNFTERNRSSFDLSNIVKEQTQTISNLKLRIKELEEDVVSKDEIIRSQDIAIKQLEETVKQQDDKIASSSKQYQVLRMRDDLEIAHLVPRLRLCLQVFENNLQEYLFESKTIMTKDEFLATLIDKLHIEKNEDALLLANYFIPNDIDLIKTWKILEKIIYIAGPYRSFKDADFVKLKETFEHITEQK